MKVRILRPAIEDLAEGSRFYELQDEGLGAHFFNRAFSEIDDLCESDIIRPGLSGDRVAREMSAGASGERD